MRLPPGAGPPPASRRPSLGLLPSRTEFGAMGKKGKWFGAVKKMFSPESKEKKEEKLRKRLAAINQRPLDLTPSPSLEVNVSVPPPPVISSVHQTEDINVPEAEPEQSKDVTVEPVPAAPAQTLVLPSGVSRDELAAIKIQTAFRGYLARRRALRAVWGLVRLSSLVEGNSIKRQAATTLRCMQTLARVQLQIRSRRLKMSEENQALQHQLLKQELENFRWDDSTQSKEQIEANIISRQEAAVRRERALAYAFSHQWKSTSRSANAVFIDPNNLQWGWSWLERWMAAKPWEGCNGIDKDRNIDRGSMNSMNLNIGEGEITKAFNRRGSKPDKPSPTTPKMTRPASRQSPSATSTKLTPILARKKSSMPKNRPSLVDDDVRSVFSVQSERPRRHTLATSTVRGNKSLPSSSSVPSYMVPTESARAKTRLQGSASTPGAETPEKLSSSGPVKKRLSFQAGMASPLPTRRHSGPPEVEGGEEHC